MFNPNVINANTPEYRFKNRSVPVRESDLTNMNPFAYDIQNINIERN
jgi:hypothetical protein